MTSIHVNEDGKKSTEIIPRDSSKDTSGILSGLKDEDGNQWLVPNYDNDYDGHGELSVTNVKGELIFTANLAFDMTLEDQRLLICKYVLIHLPDAHAWCIRFNDWSLPLNEFMGRVIHYHR